MIAHTRFAKWTRSISSPEYDHEPNCMEQFMVLYGHHVLSATQIVEYFAGVNHCTIPLLQTQHFVCV